MMSVIFRSLSSSKWAKTPALKNILLCPILYKFGSSSKARIWKEKEPVYSWPRDRLLAVHRAERPRKAYHPLTRLFAVHETLRDCIGSEDLVPVGKPAQKSPVRICGNVCLLTVISGSLRGEEGIGHHVTEESGRDRLLIPDDGVMASDFLQVWLLFLTTGGKLVSWWLPCALTSRTNTGFPKDKHRVPESVAESRHGV